MSPESASRQTVVGTTPVALIPECGMKSAHFVVTWPAAHGTHTAVLQARADDGSFVALKLAKTSVGAALVDREARVLQALSAADLPTPRFIGAGSADGRRYCASGWVPASEVRVAAAELRWSGRLRM